LDKEIHGKMQRYAGQPRTGFGLGKNLFEHPQQGLSDSGLV